MTTRVPVSSHPELSGGAASITEPMIRDLVCFLRESTQRRAPGSDLRGQVEDWPAHLENMCAFWSSATLKSGRHKGHPMLLHARISEIEKAHFMRWLVLFGETAAETCPGEAAGTFHRSGRTIRPIPSNGNCLAPVSNASRSSGAP